MTTLVTLMHQRFTSHPDAPALHVKHGDAYHVLTWREFSRDVYRTAGALRRLGVVHGAHVAQVSENRYEWVVTDLALLLLGAVHVPVHATLAGPQIAFQIRDCQPLLCLLSGGEMVSRLAQETLPEGVPLYCYDACQATLAGRPVRHWQQVFAPDDAAQGERLLAQGLQQVKPNDLATVLYTSGTTGDPKGVMLTHGNLASNALASVEAFGQQEGDVRLGWLPLSHIFARTCDLYTWFCTPGVELALGESRDTVLGDMAATRPTLLNGVPYFFDKIRRVLVEQKLDTSENLRAVFGGRIRLCCSGGAALADHVAEFYNQRGVTLVQGYGLTETSPVISVNTDTARIGSVGRPIPGVEVRIAADGEILTRGPHVMRGYRNQPKATAETIRDGWLHTGDLGRLDADGYLYITGRKKELIVTTGGKNIAPVLLESLLTCDPLIQQAMVIGDGRNYLTALIVIEPRQLEEELRRQSLDVPQAQWTSDARVRELYAGRIARQLSGVSQYEQIVRFALLREPFSLERGELTPSLKIRRNVIAEHYATEIEALYAPPPGEKGMQHPA